jgi:hypothetical protein
MIVVSSLVELCSPAIGAGGSTTAISPTARACQPIAMRQMPSNLRGGKGRHSRLVPRSGRRNIRSRFERLGRRRRDGIVFGGGDLEPSAARDAVLGCVRLSGLVHWVPIQQLPFPLFCG